MLELKEPRIFLFFWMEKVLGVFLEFDKWKVFGTQIPSAEGN